jgi:hypothetical protein
MGNTDGKKVPNGITVAVKSVLKVSAVAFLFMTSSFALTAYAKTGDSETATAAVNPEESLSASGFKPLSALPSEPNHVSDRVKLLHGSSHFILSNLNNFSYKPFHGQSMWIGEFAIPDPGSRVEVVFNIGADNVIAVAGYRVVAVAPPPVAVQAPPPAPQRVYVPTPPPPAAREPGRAYTWKPNFNVSMSFGGTYLNKDYWAPADQQSTVSITGDYNPGNWPANLLLEYSFSSNATGGRSYYHDHIAYNDVEAQISEFSVGARKYLVDTGVVRPYLSAGVSTISADLWVPTGGRSVSDSSSSLGYFGNGGIIFVMHRLYVGLDFKALGGTSVKLMGASGDANYNRWSFLFGVSF